MNFKDEYKRAAENLSPDKACVDRMRSAVLREISCRKAFPFRRIAIVGGAVAACAVITVAAFTLIPVLRNRELVSLVSDYNGSSFDSAASISAGNGGNAAPADHEAGLSSSVNEDARCEESALDEVKENEPSSGAPDNAGDFAAPGAADTASSGTAASMEESTGAPEAASAEAPVQPETNASFGDNRPDPETGYLPETYAVSDEVTSEEDPYFGDLPPTADIGTGEMAESEEDGVISHGITSVTGEPSSEAVSEEFSVESEELSAETTAVSSCITDETGEMSTQAMETPPEVTEGCDIITMEELFGESATSLFVSGNYAKLMNGEDTVITYKRTANTENVPERGAEVANYNEWGNKYFVRADDSRLIYIYNGKSGEFIGTYKRAD